MTITKPMLAGKVSDVNSLHYPVIASPKLDGIRCLCLIGQHGETRPVTRNWNLIPNLYARDWLSRNLIPGFDGELMVHGAFNEVTSAIMREEGEPDFFYAIFDFVDGCTDTNKPFVERVVQLNDLLRGRNGHIQIVEQIQINSATELEQYYDKCLGLGYEGVCIRDPQGPYKCGRSTSREGYLLKLKPDDDDEAVVLGFNEKMHNSNEAEEDAFGRTKRSSAKSGLVPTGVLGSLRVRDLKTGVEFDCAGFTDEQRKTFWDERRHFLGSTIKYKHNGVGVNNAPRFPEFLCFRDKRDM